MKRDAFCAYLLLLGFKLRKVKSGQLWTTGSRQHFLDIRVFFIENKTHVQVIRHWHNVRKTGVSHLTKKAFRQHRHAVAFINSLLAETDT